MRRAHLDVAQLDAIAIRACTIDGVCMTYSICDWATHNKSRPGVVGRVTLGADLLIRRSEQNWRLDQVLSIRTEL
jgi:hypothetical protein